MGGDGVEMGGMELISSMGMGWDANGGLEGNGRRYEGWEMGWDVKGWDRRDGNGG